MDLNFGYVSLYGMSGSVTKIGRVFDVYIFNYELYKL
jgi:hypothetical protein